KETAQLFGVSNVGKVYPWVFLGYGIAGITGPLVGGWLSDIFGNYQYASLAAALISLGGGVTYYMTIRKDTA
ncbi:TPA: MFS transporter, partial [Candidatus Marinimicrobia bacterium]|nr:MFS transporter [Candidatus Neomarinimicrobiota bacterium]